MKQIDAAHRAAGENVTARERAGGRAPAIGRRTVVGGAAWTVPAVLVGTAAPAFAASGCVVQTNFDALEPGTRLGTLTFPPSQVTAEMSFSTTGNDGDATPGDTGEIARTSSTPAWNYVEVEMLEPLSVGDAVVVQIAFSAAVSNLSFRIHDIDCVTGQWHDQVVVDTPGFTFQLGANLTGSGTAASPFENTTSYDNDIASGLADVTLTWAGPVSLVQLTYRAGTTGDSDNQHIGIGNLSFSECVPASSASFTQARRQAPVVPTSSSATSAGRGGPDR